jgi:hypothetical protein
MGITYVQEVWQDAAMTNKDFKNLHYDMYVKRNDVDARPIESPGTAAINPLDAGWKYR